MPTGSSFPETDNAQPQAPVKAAPVQRAATVEAPAAPAEKRVAVAVPKATKTNDATIVDWGDADKAFKQAAFVSTATYYCPYQSHAPFGPNCAITRLRDYFTRSLYPI